MANDHWQQYRPQMYRQLKATRKLEQALYAAEHLTTEALLEMEAAGVDPHTAWQTIREQWVILPTEKDVPNLGQEPSTWALPESEA